jgi:hypothetical protein
MWWICVEGLEHGMSRMFWKRGHGNEDSGWKVDGTFCGCRTFVYFSSSSSKR